MRKLFLVLFLLITIPLYLDCFRETHATVPVNSARDQYVGNGVASSFTGTFRILDQSHVQVFLAGVVQTLGVNYTVSGVGAATFSVTFSTPPANGASITFLRNVPLSQLTNYVANSAYPPLTVMGDLDKIWMELQQLSEKLGRTIVVPPYLSGGFPFPLPPITPIANKHLCWNSTATNIANCEPGTGGTGGSGVQQVTAGSGLSGGVIVDTGTISIATGGVVGTMLENSGVTAGSYGDATHVGAFTVDAKGRVTAASAIAIAAIGTGDALTSNPLSQFASTTSAQLAGVISNETGTGLLVFNTSPTFITPILGTANATHLSVNDLTASTPVIADSAKNLVSGSYSGNTTQLATVTGAKVAGKQLAFDASGNVFASSTDIGGSGGGVSNVSFTGGIVSVANPTTTPAMTVAGTSGGLVYFSSASTWASSALLAANKPIFGGGAGVTPFTGTSTGTTTNLVTFTGSNITNALLKQDSSGNATPSSILDDGTGSPCVGTCSGLAVGGVRLGYLQFDQLATPPTLGTTAIQFYAPTSVTSYRVALPAAAGTGWLKVTNSSNTLIMTIDSSPVTLDNIGNPSGNKIFTMGANTLQFLYSATTGSVNLFNVNDDVGNTGTGYIARVFSNTSSGAKPISITAGGTANGVEMTTAGVLQAKGSGSIVATNGVLTTRTISTTSPLGGGGDLSADRTLTCTTCVVGPSSATDNAVARFDSTTGKLIQNSLVIVDDSGNIQAGTGSTGSYVGGKLTLLPSANNVTIVDLQRFTNTSPTGKFIDFKNASGTSIGSVDVAALATFSGVNVTGLTASRPVILDSSKNLATGTYSGNTTVIATAATTRTTGKQVQYDANGNLEATSTDIGGAGGSLTVKEIDGSPTVSTVTTIQVTNGKLTDNGSGNVTIDVSGGASGTLDGARVGNSADLTLTSGTGTLITFDIENCTGCYDNGGLHSTSSNTGRITIGTAGIYTISGTITWDTGNTGLRQLFIMVCPVASSPCDDTQGSGQVYVVYVQPATIANFETQTGTSPPIHLAVGDIIRMYARHTQGSNLKVLTTANAGIPSPILGVQMVSQ